MKKIYLLLLCVIGLGLGSCSTTSNMTDAEKAQYELQQQQLYNEAVQALEGQRFVLEADRITFRRGRMAFVSSTTNFVMMKDNRATVQVAFNTAYSGPNGIGGITLDGTVSNIEKNTSRKGDVTYNFNVQGVGISAQVNITLTRGGNYASVTINPNFNSNRITMSGYIIPLEQSNVYKARPL